MVVSLTILLLFFGNTLSMCPTTSRTGACVELCNSTSCKRNYECCSNGCGHECVCTSGISNCFQDPCNGARCDMYPMANCTADYCGGCNRVWSLSDGTVVNCEPRQPQPAPQPDPQPQPQPQQCPPGQISCQCAGGSYCLFAGAMCIAPNSPCPPIVPQPCSLCSHGPACPLGTHCCNCGGARGPTCELNCLTPCDPMLHCSVASRLSAVVFTILSLSYLFSSLW
eukprot:TRINITY_DN251_c1_g1_i5.p1 TRINITY_DN251_c1_g1~~TRINITY_DN251_c1_g1_i5.p1  ORF type:complete len:225 (-),score=22.90 TRINITY_DN251_c1_g1_i5:144-818(-)